MKSMIYTAFFSLSVSLLLLTQSSFATRCNFEATTPGPLQHFGNCLSAGRVFRQPAQRSLIESLHTSIADSANTNYDSGNRSGEPPRNHPFVALLNQQNISSINRETREVLAEYIRICGIIASVYPQPDDQNADISSEQETEVRNASQGYLDIRTCQLASHLTERLATAGVRTSRMSTTTNDPRAANSGSTSMAKSLRPEASAHPKPSETPGITDAQH